MAIVYPRPIESCPSYFECGGDKWRNDVRTANNFGNKSKTTFFMNDFTFIPNMLTQHF